MRQTAARYARDPADAEDIAQEALLKAWRALERGAVPEAIASWLCRITIREARTMARASDYHARRPVRYGRAFVRVSVEELKGPRLSEDRPNDLLQLEAARDAIARALGTMPAPACEALTLYELQDWSYEQIAERQRVPLTTVRKRIHRARQIIQQELTKC